MKTSLLSLCLISFALYTAHAQNAEKKPLSANDEKALGQTTGLLTNKQIRDEAIAKDPKAVQADAYAKKVAGSKTEDVYGLASKIFERLVRKYNGDADKIKQVLADAQRNPAAFANEFTPEEMKLLKDIAGQIPGTTSPPK